MLENKERLSNEPLKPVATETLIDVRRRMHVSGEVGEWLKKVGNIKPPSVKDAEGNYLLRPVNTTDKVKDLPVSKEKFVSMLATKISEASKWFGTFLLRMIKMNGGKVKFKEE